MSTIIEIVSCQLSLRKSQIIGDCLQPSESKKAIKDTIFWSQAERCYDCQRPYKRIPLRPIEKESAGISHSDANRANICEYCEQS